MKTQEKRAQRPIRPKNCVELYPTELNYGGTLRHCVALALTYHLTKRKVAPTK